MQYKIVVEWYADTKAIEQGIPCQVIDSGFSHDLSLEEAYILKSKMLDSPCCNMLRINKIVPA